MDKNSSLTPSVMHFKMHQCTNKLPSGDREKTLTVLSTKANGNLQWSISKDFIRANDNLIENLYAGPSVNIII